MSNLYNRIDLLCRQKGVTKAQMCRDTGISQGNITDLKMGRKQTLSAKSMARMADYFKVPMDFFVGDREVRIELNPSSRDITYLTRYQQYANDMMGGEGGKPLSVSEGEFSDFVLLWNDYQTRPEIRALYNAVKDMTKDQIESIANMVYAFRSRWQDAGGGAK